MDNVIGKFRGLSMAEKIIIVAGAALFIDGFLPWYSVSAGPVSITRSAWQSPGAIWSILAVVIGLTMAGVVIAKNFTDAALPEEVGGLSWPKLFLGGGVAAAAFVLIKLVNESSYMGFAFYLGILAVGALAVAGVIMYREERALAL